MGMKSLNEELKTALTSMKRPVEKKSPNMVDPVSDEEKYPWGLRLDLNNDSMKALGLTAKDFAAGKTVTINAKCDVIAVRSQKCMKRGSNDSVELQITDLGIAEEGK